MLSSVIDIAREAGAIVLRHYLETAKADLDLETKADDSPVTIADRETNRFIVERLTALTPDVPIVAEESDLKPYAERRSWTRLWLVDPLDGTREFLKRNGEFTVNIALVEGGVPTLGVLYAPALDVLYYAERGQGAWKVEPGGDPERIHSRPPAPDKPLVVLASRSHRTGDVRDHLPGRRVAREVNVGSALKFGLLAEGKADVYVRTGPTSEWDVAAGDCIFRNSGVDGERSTPFTYNKPEVRNPAFVVGLEP